MGKSSYTFLVSGVIFMFGLQIHRRLCFLFMIAQKTEEIN